MKKNKLLFIAIIITNILLISSCNGKAAEIKSTPRAVNGFLDLSNWDFQKDGIISLKIENKYRYDVKKIRFAHNLNNKMNFLVR